MLIRYGRLTFCVLVLMLASSLLSSHQPEFVVGSTATQRPAIPLADWDILDNHTDITKFTSSVPTPDEHILVSEWGDTKSAKSRSNAFIPVESMDELSKFMTHTNANKNIIYSSV